MKLTKVQTRLKKMYYNIKNPLAYSGSVRKISNALDLNNNTKEVKKWLETQPTFTLHKPVKRKFQTRKYMVSGIDHQWQADLVDMQAQKKYNGGYAHILTAIDIFSRYAFAEPIKSKRDVREAMQKIFLTSGRKPMRLQTDQGTEFENKEMREFYKRNNIMQFSIKSPYKAAIVERFHRTLRGRMFRYFTKNGTYKWIDILQDLVTGYNATAHSFLDNKAPNTITRENEGEIWFERNEKITSMKDPIFKVGQLVRLAKVKKTFDRGYTPNWTEELFKIHSIDRRQDPITYIVSDLEDEIIEGKFYKDELQKVANVFRIEKVLKKQGKKLYVKWLGYDKPTWIWQKDLV